MRSCDNCDKEAATHFIDAASACPVYCDTYLCCGCRECDPDDQADHEEELIDSIEWSAPGAGLGVHPMYLGLLERHAHRNDPRN